MLGFAVQLFIHNYRQSWNAFNFGLNIVSDEIWEEIVLFRNDLGISNSDTIEWSPELLSDFKARVAQEFVDETIDYHLKEFGLMRIRNLMRDRTLYESPGIEDNNFHWIEKIEKKWGYKPFQFYMQNVPCTGMGYRGKRIDIHYFVGTVFENLSLRELTIRAPKYRKIASQVFHSLGRRGLALYIIDGDGLKERLDEQNAWAYVYFVDSDSLFWSSRDVDKNSLFTPQEFVEKSFFGYVRDSKGASYKQYTQIFDENPNFVYQVDIAIPCDYVHRSIALYGVAFGGSAVLIILIAGFGGRLLKRRALAPVNSVIDRVNDLSSKDIDKRIPVDNVDEEIARLISTFNHLLDRLAAAFKQQKSFIADSSHEMRTPLSVLGFDIIEALENVEKESIEAGHLREAKSEVDRLSRIVNDLQWLAKDDAGQLHMEKRKIRLDDVLMDTMSRCQNFAAQNYVRLSVGEIDAMEYCGDENLLVLAYTNLVNNAIKFSNKGGEVVLSLFRNCTMGVLQVEDFGIGIPVESLGKIFDRFYRVDASRSRATGGSGLGLAIAKQIAEKHSGRITVESSVQRGSVFAIHLPF